MKKIAKLSLVTAVAVAGLTTTSSAVSLEEAIKGVDVSGQFRYRAQELKTDNGAADATTDVEVEVGVKVPVNDNVTAVFKIDTTRNTNDSAPQSSDALDIEDYYFSYANGPLTVNFGQQNIPGRMTDGKQGDGIVALYNLGAATVGAAAFMNHNVASVTGQNAYSVIAMGNVGPVSLLGQYIDVEETLDAYNVKADATVGPAKVGVEYTEAELDNGANNDERSTFKAYVSGKLGIVSGKVAYAKTGDNGSGSVDNQTETQTETPAELLLWNIGSANRDDADLVLVDASVALTDKVSLRAAFIDGEEGNTDLQETLGQISYKMSKNLNTYFRYAQFEEGTVDKNRGRIEVKYSF